MKTSISSQYDLEALRQKGIFVQCKSLSSYAEKLFGNKDEITIEVVAKLETVLSLVSSSPVQRVVSKQRLDNYHNGENIPEIAECVDMAIQMLLFKIKSIYESVQEFFSVA